MLNVSVCMLCVCVCVCVCVKKDSGRQRESHTQIIDPDPRMIPTPIHEGNDNELKSVALAR